MKKRRYKIPAFGVMQSLTVVPGHGWHPTIKNWLPIIAPRRMDRKNQLPTQTCGSNKDIGTRHETRRDYEMDEKHLQTDALYQYTVTAREKDR